MRFSSNDEVIKDFLKKYDSIPEGDRGYISWEAVALSAGLEINHLLGSIMLALQAESVNMVKVIAVTNHPAITRARVKYGQLPSGERDRTALDTAMGFLPSPKGPTFIGKAVFGSSQATGSGTKSDDDDDDARPAMFGEDDDLDKLFPSASQTQEKLIPIRQKQLGEG